MKAGDVRSPEQLRQLHHLRDLCRLAGEQADGSPAAGLRSSSGPAAGWRRTRRLGLWKVGVIACLGVSAVAVVAAQFGGEPTPVAAAPDRTDVAAPTASGPAAIADSRPVEVRWQGHELQIDFDRVPLQQAIAVLTGPERR